MEAFEHEGVFWDCEQPDQTAVGQVRFHPLEGITLKIFGSFTDVNQTLSSVTPAVKRIHGVANRTYMTLVGCQWQAARIESPGIAREEYRVYCILSGAHFGSDDELKFDEISASYGQLLWWVNLSGFQIRFETPTPALADVSKIDVEYTVQLDEVELIDDLELKLAFTWSTEGDRVTRFNISQEAHLRLKYPAMRRLDNILTDTNGFQDLITLATDAPTVPTEIKLWRTGLDREITPGKFVPLPIELFVANAAEQVRQETPQQPERMFFLLNQIGGLGTVGRWIDVSRRYRIVLGNLLTVRYSARLYVENRYQNVISAAETFHRLRFPNYVMPATDFKAYRRKLVKAVRETVGRRSADWLMKQLLYSNEPRLKQRLEAMAAYAGEGFEAIVGDVQLWSAVVVMLRNRLTHHDAESNVRRKSEDLHCLADSIYLLVMMCLLRECDVPEGVLENIQSSERIRLLRVNVSHTLEKHQEHVRRG
jgi:hypothetical protein